MSSHGQPFPLSKLAFMYVKRVAQPVAARIIQRAEKDDWFRTHICLPPAQLYHFYETKIKFRLLNLGKIKVTRAPKMSDKAAVELGANMFAEFCILALASAIAANEVIKYKERERAEDERLSGEKRELADTVASLSGVVEQQNRDVAALKYLLEKCQEQLIVSQALETDFEECLPLM